MSNSFGDRFKFTTFGESHGKAIGCVIDGMPSMIDVDFNLLRNDLERRRPGKSKFVSSRNEAEDIEILSGIYNGKTTGAPIAAVVFNKDQKYKSYTNIKDIFRPGHADFTYFYKYGIRDYKGGGRSSARETLARVIAGSFAKMLINKLSIEIKSGIFAVGSIVAQKIDFNYAKYSPIYSLDKSIEELQKEAILKAKGKLDSIGGVALIKVLNTPIGLGEPIYNKLDARLAQAMMGINGVKAVGIGSSFNSSRQFGSLNNDAIFTKGFLSNSSGGILGGISNGDDIDVKVYFKPTPSISKPQKSIDVNNKEVLFKLKGRHDPCIAIRGSIVAEAMVACVICDMLLLNMGRKIEHLLDVYKK